MRDAAASQAQAGTKWPNTCPAMVPGQKTRTLFDGTIKISDGQGDNKVWNAWIWFDLSSSGDPTNERTSEGRIRTNFSGSISTSSLRE
jgi:hypothetical protein